MFLNEGTTYYFYLCNNNSNVRIFSWWGVCTLMTRSVLAIVFSVEGFYRLCDVLWRRINIIGSLASNKIWLKSITVYLLGDVGSLACRLDWVHSSVRNSGITFRLIDL